MTKNLALIPNADILIVDDTPHNLQLLGKILGKQYNVRLASNGQIALAEVQSSPPDLILLDIMMPEMDGYEVANQLKAGQLTNEIPIIFISALDDADSKVRAFAVGGVDYITKPFQKREVLARVEIHLSLRRLYKQAQAEIAERKRIEESLRESEELLSLFIHYSPIYAFIKAVTPTESRVLIASENYQDLMGISGSEMVGKTMEELFPAERAANFTADDWAIVSKGQVLRLDEDLNGRSYTTFKFPIIQGEKTLLAGYAVDITERKQAEEALSHRNREMAMLYETSLEINALSDISTLLLAIIRRACELLKIPSGALYLVRPEEETLELVVEHQLPPHWVGTKIHVGEGLAGQVVQTKKPMVVEDYLTWGGRLEAFYDSPARRVMGVPLKIHDQITGVIVLVDKQVGTFSEDEIRLASLFADQAAIAVSNAQFAAQLEERVVQRTSELEAANRELESLSYNIAHDMRSPVRAIVGYSGILQQTHRAQLDSEGLQLLENIHTSGMRLGQMIDGFLTFLHLGHATIYLQPVNSNSLVSRLINKQKPELKSRQIEFSVGDLPECRADPKLLEKVWEQLISNAVKFTRPCEIARIEIGSGEADGKAYYFVRDNGVGFDMKYSAKLFGVFQKLHYESEFEGTGIGLAIVKRIIQRHAGKIWVEAEVDQGAGFYFSLKD